MHECDDGEMFDLSWKLENNGMEWPDDIVYHVLQYFQSEFVFGVCVLISKQWMHQSIKIPMAIDRSEPREGISLKLLAKTQFLIPNLTELCLDYTNVKSFGCKLLSNSVCLSNLKILSLVGNKIREKGCGYLSGSKHLSHLTSLFLGDNEIASVGCTSIIMSSCWDHLTQLDVSDNGITADGMKWSDDCLFAEHLTALNLNGNRIGKEGCEKLVNSGLTNMKRLYLRSNRILEEGFGRLLGSPLFSGLEELQLDENYLSGPSCSLFSQMWCDNLQMLSLSWQSIGDVGCYYISVCGKLSQLTFLDLDKNTISDLGCEYLSQAHLVKLKVLTLRNNGICNEGCKHLVQCPFASNLTELYLNNNFIGQAGREYIRTSNTFHNLKVLGWKNNQVYFGDESDESFVII